MTPLNPRGLRYLFLKARTPLNPKMLDLLFLKEHSHKAERERKEKDLVRERFLFQSFECLGNGSNGN